ncbi:mRNA-degrading endonuclease [Candidatus Kaiserbacteria bacterium CG10_big_fil_rev_8_21_14_0_10_44_10]|uniref:mRNA interferase n=1 Tax=Candidatus Kaiserbacteria bacterium CG10_big_fil_rev_8_21_14_0_10_44_10 TaxID=1974606 RepID=A0A2H0UH26_9BACT|nr:MAG: mRNA-degrading endonuclease [Candidatus Kaiserbacteria bacterium CG10_big_fil_rev_8_21_14_0_10_44_10]
MVNKSYTPDRGDLVWVDFNPTRGREQAKVRPAIVVSPKTYNQKTNLAIMCPITSVQKNYPFEVKVEDKKVSGVILSDHVRSLDWKVRNTKFISKAKQSVIAEVQTKLGLLVCSK